MKQQKKTQQYFVFNEAKGKSGIRRNTNWMISAVPRLFSVLLLYQLSDIVREVKITEGRDTENVWKTLFLAFHAKLKFILLLFISKKELKRIKGRTKKTVCEVLQVSITSKYF